MRPVGENCSLSAGEKRQVVSAANEVVAGECRGYQALRKPPRVVLSSM